MGRLTLISFWRKHRIASRLLALLLVLVILFGIFFEVYDKTKVVVSYDLSGSVSRLIPEPVDLYADKLVYAQEENLYSYNNDFVPGGEVDGDNYAPQIQAAFSAGTDASVKVTDPINKVSIKLTPKFAVRTPIKDKNRIIYPLNGWGTGAAKVYTLKGTGVKEDIILREMPKRDSYELSYDLELDNGLEARLEVDGSIGFYGVDSALLGNVTTGTEADAQLLDKARKNGAKTQFLFKIPAPYVVEKTMKDISPSVKSEFALDGNVLTLKVSGLLSGNYPLSIDPTIYVETARKLMRGNNETNIDFDVTNELIQKSQTTGARIDAWSSTTNLSTAVWGQGTAVAGGFIYSAGGGGGDTTTTTTYYADGTDTYVVPVGVTSITAKVWGAGAGGGAGNGQSGTGGSGGGGGYAKSILTVTPGETLDITIGTGGAGAGGNRRGGDGGGFSAIRRSGTYLLQAGGGGGGGGAEGTNVGDGGNGGAGGGTSGVAGTNGENTGFGGGAQPGSTGAGGTGGSAGTGGAAGAAGAANAGGDAGGSTGTCNAAVTGTGGAGGTGAGGDGGDDTTNCEGGGGGGGGRFGGGGGGSANSNNRGAGGGGGGSSLATGSSIVETAGSGTTPGNNGDTDRNGAGQGGAGSTSTTGAAGTDGAVVITYTISSPSTVSTVSWAQFNSSTNAIESPNPGTGACAGWCNESVYDLPVALRGLSLVAYNGFLYAIGGSTSAGTPQTTVYIAKLGANGEPQLWHPTGGTPVYWYSDTALSNARSQFAAVAYNNRMYLLGGLTTSSTVLSSNTVQYADVRPNGTLTTWTATGMQALSSSGGGNRYGLTAHIYNGYMYVLGGNATFSGTPVTNVDYAKLNTDGTMNAWVATDSINTAGRLTLGGSFSTVSGGYLYINGGCSAVNASGYCTSIASDVQLSSINADGSLAGWNAISTLSNDRFAHTMIAWQGGLYRLGGCRAQDSGTGICTNTVLDVDYGVINPDGEASTVATSTASGAAPCSGAAPYNCNIPSASIGNMLNATAIVNGYLYIMGGCTNNACTSYSNGVTYQAVASDGSLQRPTSCGGTYTDSYCVSYQTLPVASGASGVAVFNNRIYIVGGFPTVDNIYYVSVNADGSLGTWQNNNTNTGTTTLADQVSYLFSYARANPSSAGSNPGNLYIVGGCSQDGGGSIASVGCSGYSSEVWKCNITTSGTVTSCSTSGQLQIGAITGNDDLPTGGGLGAFAGAVYANYIYLMGGLSTGIADNGTDLTHVRYARFDDNNDIVAVSGSDWIEGTNEMVTGRRRGTGFGYNGYLYVMGGYDGADAIADIEFAKINVSDGSWELFDQSSVTIQKRWALTSVVSNSYAYVIGGCTAGAAPSSCSTRTNTIQTFQIYNNDSGTPVSYSASANQFTTDRMGAGSVIYNGYIYIAGGCISTSTDCDSATDNVQFAPLDAYGNISSAWANTTDATLPTALAHGKLLEAGGTLYWVGGQTTGGTASNEVFYGVPASDGNVSTWALASNVLPAARSQIGAAEWNDRLYVVGGVNGGTVQSTVYVSPTLSSSVGGGNIGSAWSSSTAFEVARSGTTAIAYANNLYIFGGYDGTNYLNDAQFASIGYKTGTISQSGINVTGSGTTWTSAMIGTTLQYRDGEVATILTVPSATTMTVSISKTVTAGTGYTILDGSVGPWTNTTSLPGPIRQADGFAANGYVYLVGGRSSDTNCASKTLVTPVSANTTIATGNNSTGVGEWFETNVKYSGRRYGAAVAYANGKYYTSGGVCNGFPSVKDRLTQVFSTADDNHLVTMPSSVDSGDLLLVLFTNDDTDTVTDPDGGGAWTSIASSTNGTMRASVWGKVATGAEDGTTVDFLTGTTEEAAAHVYRIPAGEWSGNIAGVEASAASGANTASPDPASLNPGAWGTENTLWIAYAGGASFNSVTTYPTNFTGGAHTQSNAGTAGASVSSAWQESAAASLNPGTFTMNAANDSVAYTIGIRPAGYALTGANKVVQTAVYSQSQVAIYSRMIDTDTDVFPTSYLLNGIDNSTGARWQTKYRSMHDINATLGGSDSVLTTPPSTYTLQQNPNEDCGTSSTMAPMTTWGTETNNGDTTLGDVVSYTPLNGSGGNINCARYYYFYVSIDASRTFGYPEDVTRGPTIADLSLFFTSDPSKRLRHGKTFTGGEQQPLDTPCRQSVDAQCPLP